MQAGTRTASKGVFPQPSDLRAANAPSFGLTGHESIIQQRSDIGASSISDGSFRESIKDCLRRGRCKPVCATGPTSKAWPSAEPCATSDPQATAAETEAVFYHAAATAP